MLPRLANLSKALQHKNLDFSSVKCQVHATILYLQSLKESTESIPSISQTSNQLIDAVEESSTMPIGKSTNDNVEQFKLKVFRKMLEDVVENLQQRFPEQSLNLISAASIFEANSYDKAADYGREELGGL